MKKKNEKPYTRILIKYKFSTFLVRYFTFECIVQRTDFWRRIDSQFEKTTYRHKTIRIYIRYLQIVNLVLFYLVSCMMIWKILVL